MNPQFDNPEDVDREYGRRIENEPDTGRKADLRVEAAEAKIALKERADQQRMFSAWKKLAIMEYPHAAKFAEMVVGNTEEELRQSAEDVHKRVEGMMKATQGGSDGFDQVRQQAQDFYGRGPTTGGSSGTPSGYAAPNAEMAAVRRENAFAEKFNNAETDLYGQRLGISPKEVNDYTTSRFVSQVKSKIAFWGNLTRSDRAGR